MLLYGSNTRLYGTFLCGVRIGEVRVLDLIRPVAGYRLRHVRHAITCMLILVQVKLESSIARHSNLLAAPDLTVN